MSVEYSIHSSTSNESKPNIGSAPEGKLGKHYDYAVSRVLEKFLGSIRYSVLKSKYPEMVNKCGKDFGSQFKDLHKQLRIQLRNTIAADIKVLSAETSVLSSLKSLDDLIAEQKDKVNEDAWRPSGNPEDDIRDHIYHQKLKNKKCLEFVLETFMVENNKLEERVEQSHTEILGVKEEIDKINEEVQSNLTALNIDTLNLNEDIHRSFGRS